LRGTVIEEQLVKHLTDAHAIEEQSLTLLRRACRSSDSSDLRELYEQQLSRGTAHRRLLRERLEAHGAKSSAIKDAAMRLGGLNWSMLFQAQPETPGKSTAFAFALTHLKIAGYELLKRVALKADDGATVVMAEQVLADEQAGASRLSASFDRAVEAAMEAHPTRRNRAEELLSALPLPEGAAARVRSV
jgi:ferritin-like metal-binding protein YciE